MTFIKTLAFSAGALLLAATPQTAAAESKTVIELFTSQGCSSCPPADKLIPTYINRSDVIPLTFNVDYWDYLGWKDTLAKNKYTQRQRSYASTRGDGNVYTPQTVINGMTHAVGSRKNSIDNAIRKTSARLGSNKVNVALTRSGKRMEISIGTAATNARLKSATVWVASVIPKVSVEIKRGENYGRNITYYNVVKELRPVGMWDGKSKKIVLPSKHFISGNARTSVVFLQATSHGPIIGAAEYRLSTGS